MPHTPRRVTAITAASTALLAALATVAASAPASASTASGAAGAGVRPNGVIQSDNWAGYAADTATYTSVAASWVEPSVTCGSQDAYSAIWVGLDGFSNSALEQTGTEADCIGGKAQYGAWWEVLPASESVYSGVTVKGGDHLSASVTFNGGTSFTMSLTDSTQGWTKTTTHAGSSGFQNSSAEVISEGTSVGGTLAQPLAQTVAFSGCLVDGTALGGYHPDEIVAPDATVSAIGTGESFTVRWGGGS